MDAKKAEHRRTDAFGLRVPWKPRSNQSILMEINLEYSLEGLIQKLKLQYFGHLMRRANSSEKTLMLGKTEGRRRRGDRGWLDGIIDLNGHEFKQAPGVGDGQGILECCSPWGHKESDTTEKWTRWRLQGIGLCHVTSTLDCTLLRWESLEIKLKLFTIQLKHCDSTILQFLKSRHT